MAGCHSGGGLLIPRVHLPPHQSLPDLCQANTFNNPSQWPTPNPRFVHPHSESKGLTRPVKVDEVAAEETPAAPEEVSEEAPAAEAEAESSEAAPEAAAEEKSEESEEAAAEAPAEEPAAE